MGLAQRNSGRRRDPGYVDGGCAPGGGPVPELALIVIAPAFDPAARQQGARVGLAQRNSGRRRDPGYIDGGVAVRGGPVPELALIVIAPALDRAARQQCARVGLAQRNSGRRRDPGYVDGGCAVRGGPVPELALIARRFLAGSERFDAPTLLRPMQDARSSCCNSATIFTFCWNKKSSSG